MQKLEAQLNGLFVEQLRDMPLEILLCHMGVINIHGYCHARVHAGVAPTVPHSSIFFSSFFVSSCCSC